VALHPDLRVVLVTVASLRARRAFPVPVAEAFEGETVRRDDMQVQFGGKYTTAFEFLRMRPMDQVEDGKITLVGADCDSVELGGAMPLGMFIEVAGRKMQEEFEPILERQVHTLINHAMGVFHMGQRDITWVRISKNAFNAGLRLRHFGELLRAVASDGVEVYAYTCRVSAEEIVLNGRVPVFLSGGGNSMATQGAAAHAS
jgi:CO dehydrogenase/acetyl-CoA synthase beta subunit